MSSRQDIYINFSDNAAPGESTDSQHKGWIDVLSFSYGISQSSSAFTGAGSGVGKANFDVLSFTHYVDSASPNLFNLCASGKPITTVTLDCCKSGDGAKVYLQVILTDVIVVHVSPSGGNAEELIHESVSLSYGAIEIKYKPQDQKGNLGAENRKAWNVKENKVG